MWDTLHNRARLGLFQDADFAGDLEDSKSVTEGIFFMSKRQMQEEHEEHSNNRVVANSLRETLVSLVLANVVFASKLGSESHEPRET